MRVERSQKETLLRRRLRKSVAMSHSNANICQKRRLCRCVLSQNIICVSCRNIPALAMKREGSLFGQCGGFVDYIGASEDVDGNKVYMPLQEAAQPGKDIPTWGHMKTVLTKCTQATYVAEGDFSSCATKCCIPRYIPQFQFCGFTPI